MRAMWMMGLALAGCGGTLAGDWEGEIGCPGGGGAGLAIELGDPAHGVTSGSGTNWFWDSSGYYWEIAFELTVDHGALHDGAELDVEVDDCVEFELGPLDCIQLDDVVLAGGNIEGDVDDYFGALGCTFELEPD